MDQNYETLMAKWSSIAAKNSRSGGREFLTINLCLAIYNKI